MSAITHYVPRYLITQAIRDAGLADDVLDVDPPPVIAGLTAAPAPDWSLHFEHPGALASFFLRLGALADDDYGGVDWIEDMIDRGAAAIDHTGFALRFPGYALEG